MHQTEILVLELLAEDYYGLWELEIQVERDRGELREAILDLVAKGFANWFVSSSVRDVPEPILDRSHWPSLEAEADWMATPLESPQLLLGSTPEGQDFYVSHTSI
jgi:hypothetical protein